MMATCTFTYDHYDEIITEAKDKFEFSTFTTPPDSQRRIYLRHDVDVSLEDAVKMAQLEADHDISATYFVALNSPYYNLLNDTQIERVRKLSRLGHSIGFHVDERAPYVSSFDSLDGTLSKVHEFLSQLMPLDKVISFHMPSEYEFTTTTAIGSFINAYSKKFNNGSSVKYLSDSGRRWREGCFHEHLIDPDYHSYQVLIHPVWWNDRNLSAPELYNKLQESTEKGLRVNLKEDIQIFNKID